MILPKRLPEPPNIRQDRCALFLDIDGTLLEHADHPDKVVVGEALRALLLRADERLDGALAFVTGRSIAQADKLFHPLKLRSAGLYGIEHRRSPDQPIEQADEPADIAALADEIEAELENVYVERKGAVLAVHTRAAPHLLARAEEIVARALETLPEGYRSLVGNAGLELMPLDAVKGGAIRRFMAQAPFHGRIPVFLGDDTSDETGFEAVNEMGGVSVRVKEREETSASFMLADVKAVIGWLQHQFPA
jgi:trehalose 6-phosphate phosphatase